MGNRRARTILCLADAEKGHSFIREVKEQGYKVILLTRDDLAEAGWPWGSIDEFHTIHDLNRPRDLLDFALWVARGQRIDRVVGLDEYDTTRAAEIRELYRLEGMTLSGALRWRDKLAMRHLAAGAGIPVPPFVGFFNQDDVWSFLDRTPGPWLVKPRTWAGSLGIRKYGAAHEVRAVFESLGRESADLVLEKFIDGDVYHVDGIVDGGLVLFSQAHRYGRPLLQVAHEGGIFTSATVDRESEKTRRLVELHASVVSALGLDRGVTHAEFIDAPDGRLVFVEIACRVGGAHLYDLIEATCGLNMWREWARLIGIESSEPYVLPPTRSLHGGLVLCLARQEKPDMGAYTDPEIALKVQRKHHAGIVLTAPTPERAQELIRSYARRFTDDFLAVLPAVEKGIGNEGPSLRGLIRAC
jgi:biotin carboxylase